MMEAAIEARELRYIYEDGTAALKGINLRAERGKITGILGANGAGKSTLFLNLNGVLQPSDGEILLDGVPVKRDRKGLTELRRRVGIVFQDPDDQLFSADVYRDISFGAVNLGLPEAEVRRRVEAAMERTGVSHLRDKPTHALSFGQKKRVAIAGVLVMEPEALILDEPTAGLDPQGVSDLLELLTSLRDSQGMTILMATHDMDVVPLCCDYAYLLGGGSVLAQGTPEELFTKAVLAVPDKGSGEKTALTIAGELAEGKEILLCDAPMVRDEAALDAAYEANADRVCALLDGGKDVAFLTLGDPTVYSTYLYLHRKVVARGYEAEIIPGVPSFCAVAARLGAALCEKSERLLIVPASHKDVDDCLDVDANLVFMKAGREIGALKEKLAEKGLLERASMVANCGMEGEAVYPRFAELTDGSGYFSVVLVKKGEEA